MTLTKIKSWAEDDRPREKLLQKGRYALTDAELLAIIIGAGTREFSAVDLAKQILSASNNQLLNLSKVSVKDLMRFKGVGEARAVAIFAAMELARRRSACSEDKKVKITGSNDAYITLKTYLTGLNHEEFYCIFLNRANEILSCDQISVGGLSGTIADGKIIFRKALEHRSSAIILAHNHPSGQLKPSEADKRLTKSLMQFGNYIDLQIIDHIIVTENNYFSFADEGILQ